MGERFELAMSDASLHASSVPQDPPTVRSEEPQPSPHSLYLAVTSDVWIWTRFDNESGHHFLTCDLCGFEVSAGTGHVNQLLNHRNKSRCRDRQGKAAHAPTPKYTTPVMANSAPAIPATPTRPTSFTCPGASMSWKFGSFWNTYPFQEHIVDDIGWLPCKFDAQKNRITFRADACTGSSDRPDSACETCIRTIGSVAFQKMLRRAAVAKPYTPYHHLSHSQLQALARRQLEEKGRLRSKVQSLTRRHQALRTRVQDHERILMLASQKDIRKLRWVLAAAMKGGATPRKILSIVTLAADGRYRARGFDDRLRSLSFLSAYAGGARMHTAMCEGLGLLSKSTLERHAAVPRLLPSISTPVESDVNHNISAFMHPDIRPLPDPVASPDLRPGVVVMFDGVAVETRARYDQRRDQVLGLARETVGNLSTSAASVENVEAIRRALQDGTAAFGSEATVLAVAPYARSDHYTPIPLLASPSNKTETADKLYQWMVVAIRSWNEHTLGGKAHGRIWSLASDGDATYRRAKHMICVVSELDSRTPLGRVLSRLPGFNRYASASGELTATCDPKHVFKRFATLLRSSDGIMLFGTNIRPNDIISVLRVFTGMDYARARNLLDPADKQNVPKAVSLLQGLHALNTLPPVLEATPRESQKRSAVLFFSDILWLFLTPFITVQLSLQQQLESLAAFSHAMVILYRTHGNTCFTGALYYDTQAIIKNIFIVVARMQLLDPNLCFWLLLEGTDRLEQIFSEVRTLDHAHNFDILQLAMKLAVATLIQAVYERHPSLNRGHRRLDVSRTLGIDHLNPKSWVGDVRVGNVDLARAWEVGRQTALQRFRDAFQGDFQFDFDALFSQPGHDVLRPKGQYVGVDEKGLLEVQEDRSERTESVQTDHIPLSEPVVATPAPAPAPARPFAPPTRSSQPASLVSQLSRPPQALPPADDDDEPEEVVPTADTAELARELDLAAGAGGIELDDLFPDEVVDSSSPELETTIHEKVLPTFVDSQGKTFYKSSYVSTLSPDQGKKLTTRPLRVQGRTLEDFHKTHVISLNDTNLDATPTIKCGDIVGFHSAVAGDLAFTPLEITAFRLPTKDVCVSLTLEEYEKYAKDPQTKIIGQILQLQQSAPAVWTWTGKYIPLDNKADQQVSHARYVLEVPATFTILLAPMLSQVVRGDKAIGPSVTWSFPQSDLVEACDDAWQALSPETEEILANIFLLPVIENTKDLPIRSQDGSIVFKADSLPRNLAPSKKLKAGDYVDCALCGASLKLSKMRDHVGQHILLATRRIRDPAPACAEVEPEPCGFCGREGCATILTFGKNDRPIIKSNCPYHYQSMKYNSASESSDSSPSSNVPIHCHLCPASKAGLKRTIWKYNALYHCSLQHADQAHHDQHAMIHFLRHTIVRKVETRRMGIPDAHEDEFRRRANLPDSDAVDSYVAQAAT